MGRGRGGRPRHWSQLRSGGICICFACCPATLHCASQAWQRSRSWLGRVMTVADHGGASVLPSAPKFKSGLIPPTHFSQVEG